MFKDEQVGDHQRARRITSKVVLLQGVLGKGRKEMQGCKEDCCQEKHQIRRYHPHPMNFSIVTENAPESTFSMVEMNH